MSVLTQNIDSHPYTDTHQITGQLRLSTKSWLDNYFNGTPNYDQVTNVTRGKIYNVISKTGYGDVEDITFINDNGQEQTLGSFFFEELTTSCDD